MDDRFLTLISFVMGIVPTFGLLFAITSRFERHLDEKDSMISFIIGLFAGIPLAVAHMYFSYTYGIDRFEFYIAVLMFAPVEVLAYQIFLNRKKFRGRKDVPFVALGFCLGASATYIGFITGWMLRSLEVGTEGVLGAGLFALGVGTAKAALAFQLSRGNTKNMFRKELLMSVVSLLIVNLFLFMYLYSLFLWPFAIPLVLFGTATLHHQLRRLGRAFSGTGSP